MQSRLFASAVGSEGSVGVGGGKKQGLLATVKAALLGKVAGLKGKSGKSSRFKVHGAKAVRA